MPRFARGEFRRYEAATHSAYELGTPGPLLTYQSLTAGQIPGWAAHEITRNLYNLSLLTPVSSGHAADPDPLPMLTLPAGSTIVDALIRLGGETSGQLRTARVHLEGWMTDDDVLARVKQIVEDWNNGTSFGPKGTSAGLPAATIEYFWRVR